MFCGTTANLVTIKPEKRKKIEFIGNSITCGAQSDPSDIPCDEGEYMDHQYAYLAYGPIFKEIKIEKNKVVVTFDFAEGLHFSNNKIDEFEIASEDNVFYKAVAIIKKNNVFLKSDKVKKPTKVRFAWENTAQAQLFNEANLHTSSFTTE